MGSTWIKQGSSINKTNWECTCDNGIGFLSILLGEGEDSSLSSASLLAGKSLPKSSSTASTSSASPLLGHELRGARLLKWWWLELS